MRSIRLFGLTLLALFAFGAMMASAAMAVEPGLLFLSGEKGPVSISGKDGVGSLTGLTAKKTIECKKSTILPTESGAESHVILIKDVDLHFSECKEGKLACNTEGDAKEVILLLADLHFVALLEGEKLRPGVAIIILNKNLELVPISIKCGVGIIEAKNVVFGLVLAALEPTDVTTATIHFPTALPCDNSDTLCKELAAKPLESNFTGKFEPAEEKDVVEAEFSKMVLIDD